LDVLSGIVVIALGLVLAVFLVFVGLGERLLRLLGVTGTLSLGERFVSGVCLGALVVALAVWAVGSFAFSVATMGATLAMAGIVALPGLIRLWPELGSSDALAQGAKGVPLLASLCGALALAAIIGSFAPASDADTLRYHFSLAKRDLELGRIVAIYGWSVFDFFPQFGELLFRLAYALAGTSAAQLITTGFTFVTAAAIAVMTRQLGLGPVAAWVSALFYLALRTTIEQSGSGNIDHILAALIAAATVAFVAWRRSPSWSLAVTFGLLLGGALNVKYHALPLIACWGVCAAVDAVANRRPLMQLIAAGAVAGLIWMPMLSRNWAIAGSPVFPLLNDLFSADGVAYYDQVSEMRKASGLLDVLLVPLNIFLKPELFDGHQFGVPFILIFLPFSVLRIREWGVFAIWAGIILCYAAIWYGFTSREVRYLVPVMPLLVSIAGAGAVAAWQLVRDYRILRLAFMALMAVAGIGQSVFLAATLARRLPPVIEPARAAAYLELPFYAFYSHYRACAFITERLAPGETYVSVLQSPSFYCPMASLLVQYTEVEQPSLFSRGLPQLSAGQIADRLEKANARWVIAHTLVEMGRPEALSPIAHRLEYARLYSGPIIDSILKLSPVFQTKDSAVYDARQVIGWLRNSSARLE
jgi:hypothetical protein